MMQKCFLSLLQCLLGNFSVDVICSPNCGCFTKGWLDVQWPRG